MVTVVVIREPQLQLANHAQYEHLLKPEKENSALNSVSKLDWG